MAFLSIRRLFFSLKLMSLFSSLIFIVTLISSFLPDLDSDTGIPLKILLRDVEWSRNSCCWPIGDPKLPGFSFWPWS